MTTSAALALLLLPTVASGVAPAFALDTMSETHTPISGYLGTDYMRGTIDLVWAGVTEIEWRENIDRPCWIRAHGKDPENGSSTRFDVSTICGTPSHTSQRRVFFEGNPRYFVRGIAVCTNNNDAHRVKGIKIVAAKLPVGSDEIEVLTVTDKATHLNCDEWQPTVYCPEHQVANGIDIEADDMAFVGLGLRCVSRE